MAGNEKPTNPSHGELLETRIAEIQERADKAEPGPWKLYVYDLSTDGIKGPYGADVTAPIEGRLDINYIGEHEARFIAHARADIPFLLEQLAELRSLILGKMGRDREWLKKRAEGEDEHLVLAGVSERAEEGWRINVDPADGDRVLQWTWKNAGGGLMAQDVAVLVKEWNTPEENAAAEKRLLETLATASRLQSELEEAKRLVRVVENAFQLRDAFSVEGRAGELNGLQIAKAWLALEKRAEAAEARLAAQPDVRELLKTLREDLGDIECASHEQARKVNAGLDKFEKALDAHLAPQAGEKWIPGRHVWLKDGTCFGCVVVRTDENKTGECPHPYIPAKTSEREPSASHTPRCPKCGDDGKGLGRALVVGLSSVKCWACGARFEIKSISDFAQFFPVTSSQGGAE